MTTNDIERQLKRVEAARHDCSEAVVDFERAYHWMLGCFDTMRGRVDELEVLTAQWIKGTHDE